MKTLKQITSLCILLLAFLACEKDDDFNLGTISAPTNVSASFEITQDNSGLVTIIPEAEGASEYKVYFGDGTTEPVTLKRGENTSHTYSEGTYQVKVEGYSLDGQMTEATKELVVAFRAPENLEVTAEVDASNPFQVNVSATADYATSFNVFFDTSNTNEEPTPLAIDGQVSNEYSIVGDYTIRVVALSGGAETTETTTTVTINVPTLLPIDFEVFNASEFIGFGGASAEVVDNPDINGNISAKVGKIVKGGPEVWAGTVITTSAPIDFSNKKLIKMDLWSPRAGGKVLLKLENISDGNIFYEKETTTTGNGAWEEVVFDVSDIDISQEYQKVVLFFDFGTVGAGGSDWTFYVDNIKQASSTNNNSVTPINFERDFVLSSFDGGEISIVDNPDTNGNASPSVAKLVKGSGQTWAGSKITVNSPFEITESVVVKAKVWSPRSGLQLLMKFEDATPWPDTKATAEITATTTVANAWEELSFTITGVDASVDYNNLVLIIDNGTAGDGSDNYTIYVDDISVVSYLDFEYPFQLSSFDGGEISIVDNPDTNGNASPSVAKLVKGSGQTWAGSKITVNTPFDITESVVVKAKVWSPRSGLQLLMKFEDATPWPDTKATAEITATTSVANAWEELSFTITGVDANVDYNNLVLIIDNGTAGDGSDNYTIYIDDISLN